MKPIPKDAMQVVRILRRDVPRPKELPTVSSGGSALRWQEPKPYCCPMGLHPKANDRVPMDKNDLPIASTRAIMAFYIWWDHVESKDAKKAVDAVWPKKKRKAKR